MARRQGLMEKYKQQMKAYKKHKSKVDTTPYYDSGTTEIIVAYVANPDKKFRVPLVDLEIDNDPAEALIAQNKMDENGNRFSRKKRRSLITSVKCPVCGEWMEWSNNWGAFKCSNKEGHTKIAESDPERYSWFAEFTDDGQIKIKPSLYFEIIPD